MRGREGEGKEKDISHNLTSFFSPFLLSPFYPLNAVDIPDVRYFTFPASLTHSATLTPLIMQTHQSFAELLPLGSR